MQLTVTRFAHVQSTDFPVTRDTNFNFFGCDMTEYGYVNLGEVHITIEFDDKVAVISAADSIKQAIAALKAETFAKTVKLETAYNDLLLLGYTQ